MKPSKMMMVTLLIFSVFVVGIYGAVIASKVLDGSFTINPQTGIDILNQAGTESITTLVFGGVNRGGTASVTVMVKNTGNVDFVTISMSHNLDPDIGTLDWDDSADPLLSGNNRLVIFTITIKFDTIASGAQAISTITVNGEDLV